MEAEDLEIGIKSWVSSVYRCVVNIPVREKRSYWRDINCEMIGLIYFTSVSAR